MADSKISGLPEITTFGSAAIVPIQADPTGTGTTQRISSHNLARGMFVNPLSPSWPGTAGLPLISASWDGDARSTTAKTLIDLSAVFGVPAGVSMILARFVVRDLASAGAALYVGLSPNNTASSLALGVRPSDATNDLPAEGQGLVPCNADGDVYYEIVASGTGTMDAWLEIWGYIL